MRSPARAINSTISGSPSRTVAFLAGGQHAIDAERDQRVERLEGIGGRVEGAVKGHGERTGKPDQRPCPRRVDFARRRQKADHDSVGALRLGGFDVGPHGRELIVVEQEVAAARPDHHVKRNALYRPRLADQAAARRYAPLEQVGAELDARRALRLGRANAGD
jgi:hypothetical protein